MFEDEVARLFPALAGTTYLNTATMGVPPSVAVEALRAAADDWGRGRLDWAEAERAGDEARAMFGRLVHAPAEAVAIIPYASAVAGLLAEHLLRRRPAGGNIVVGAEEFTSNLFPWKGLEPHGFEVRMITDVDGVVPEAAIAAAVDRETRLVAASAVQSASGYRADIARLREAAGSALLYVDAAQAAGMIPIDVTAIGIDALAAPSHQFLVGVRGLGYGVFSARVLDRMTPVWPGWKAAASPMTSFYGPEMVLSPTASRLDMPLPWLNALAERKSMRALPSSGRTGSTRTTRRWHPGLPRDWRMRVSPPRPRRHAPLVHHLVRAGVAGRRTGLADAGVIAGRHRGRPGRPRAARRAPVLDERAGGAGRGAAGATLARAGIRKLPIGIPGRRSHRDRGHGHRHDGRPHPLQSLQPLPGERCGRHPNTGIR